MGRFLATSMMEQGQNAKFQRPVSCREKSRLDEAAFHSSDRLKSGREP
jgi:hypothetical protein